MNARVALIAWACLAASQEANKPACECKPREVGASGSKVDWPGYRNGGLKWHYSVDEAMKIAKDEKKLVFWYHVAGDLDKEGC
jgi:hypothetical protein